MDASSSAAACPLCGRRSPSGSLRAAGVIVRRCVCGLALAAAGTPEVQYESGYFSRWRPQEQAVRAMKMRTYSNVLAHVLRESPGARRILDVGCALGWSLDAARSAGLEPSGVEVSTYAAHEAAARHDVRTSMSDFPAGSFDAVTMVDVIEHIRDPLAFLGQARRLLAPRGVLVLTTPDLSSLTAACMSGRWPQFKPEHIVYFDRATIRRALQRAGFAVRWIGPFRKSLRADYVASILSSHDSSLSHAMAGLLRPFGSLEVRLSIGEMAVVARDSDSLSEAV